MAGRDRVPGLVPFQFSQYYVMLWWAWDRRAAFLGLLWVTGSLGLHLLSLPFWLLLGYPCS